jgi:hypothetical protein
MMAAAAAAAAARLLTWISPRCTFLTELIEMDVD